MNYKSISNIFIVITSFLMVQCTGYQHIPNPQYIPLNEKKGEIKAVFSFNTVQAGYSFTDNLSAFAGYTSRYKEKTENLTLSENSGEIHSTYSAKDGYFGLSFFKPLKNFRTEILAGVDLGKSYSVYNEDNEEDYDYHFRYDARKMIVFLQPNIGYKIQEGSTITEAGFFAQFNKTSFFDLNTFTDIHELVPVKDKHSIFLNKSKINFYFIEPGFFLSGGNKYMRVQFIVSPKSFCLNNRYLNFREFNAYLSFQVSLDLFNK